MKKETWLAAVLLSVLTLAVFLPVMGFDFVHWDDDTYVLNNARVQAGLSANNITWAFTTTYFGYYYPLTWISHMLDCQLYGLSPGGHHATSLLIHLANVLLLFAALYRMTGAVWRSCIVAALFAIHPQHVESVAWIAERKDVLSTFFCLIAIVAYARYAAAPSITRYLAVAFAFLVGLLAKPMIVTLPFLLLALDYWPLERWPGTTRGAWKRLVLEKLPLLALLPIFGAVTYVAQTKINAVASVDAIPLAQRTANALISYVTYIVKMIAPLRLTAFYTHPRGNVSYPLAAAYGVLLVVATVLALRFGRRRRYLAVGWFWYVISLAPVIGLIQVGNQASADRYTYVAFVGLFVIAVWGAADLFFSVPGRRRIAASSLATVVVLAFALRARAQVFTWKDSTALFTTMVAISPAAPVAQYNLGKVRDETGQIEEAVAAYRKAIEFDPARADAWTNLGIDLQKLGQKDDALKAFLRSDEAKPGIAATKFNIGLAHEASGQFTDALRAYDEAHRLDPGLAGLGPVRFGTVYEQLKMWPEAARAFEQATRDKPDDAESWAYLALAYQNQQQLDKAAGAYSEALRLNPGFVFCRYNLGILALKAGDIDGAMAQQSALQGLDEKLADGLRGLIQARSGAGSR